MKHDRDSYPYQGKSDRQTRFSHKVTHYAIWLVLTLVAGYKLIELLW